jgi:GntR family transcriptional regulator, vanillate catabolism transcriptional regulator
MRTRTEVVTNILRDRILRGDVAAGAHLQEIPISEDIGISRTPVRAALQALAAEGLLEYRPKRGYTVRHFSIDEIEAAHEVRANLEGLACRMAAERGVPPKEAAQLKAALAVGDRILARGRLEESDREAWTEMNDLFHGLIIDLAGNRLLAELIERTYRVPLASSRVIHWYDYQAVRGSHALHHRIYRYLVAGKAVSAESAMREHILQAVDQIRLRASVPEPATVPAAD